MKVIDFGAGSPLAIMNNWCQPNSGGGAFVKQPFITTILDGIPDEVHCYDSVYKSERETKKTFMGDVGRVVLHENQSKLPRSIDMVCAFNPDPVSIFEGQVNTSYPKLKQAQYIKYVSSLAHMVDVRLRIGGILAVQFDECVKPPMNVPYDATQIFLAEVLGNAQSSMEDVYHSDCLSEVSGVVPFKGVYSFSSLHIYKKTQNIPGK